MERLIVAFPDGQKRRVEASARYKTKPENDYQSGWQSEFPSREESGLGRHFLRSTPLISAYSEVK
jgi:hypothetical protein